MSSSRFDDIFSAATQFSSVEDEPSPTPPKSTQRTQTRSRSSKVPANPRANDFWSNFENKDDRIRLNVDISNSLNERLSAKAKKLGQPKTELVRRLIEWALEEDNE
jgi:hypothetical protein